MILSLMRSGIFVLLFLGQMSAMATTYVVDRLDDGSDADTGDNICAIATAAPSKCTLRAAIEQANAHAGSDIIQFSLGLISISISGSALPTITEDLTIDGRTAPNYNAAATKVEDAPPSIYINGSNLTGTSADGFRVIGGALKPTRIYAIGIVGFPDNGIELNNDTAAIIDGNWIGTDRAGGKNGNDGNGVHLDNCERCVIGQSISPIGDSEIVGIGNVISNNAEDGIYVTLGSGNVIAGNLIGVDPVSDLDHGNAGHGIYLLGPDNLVGQFRGLTDGVLTTPNTIKNNDGDGIRTFAGGHKIYTNIILGNAGNGVSLNGANNNLGFVSENQINYIRANGNFGVEIGNSISSSDNTVQNNRIYENQVRGLQVSSGSNNTISKNDFIRNKGDAIRINSAGNHVIDNGVGFLDVDVFGNDDNGIVLAAGGNDVSGNRIAEMTDDGIDVVSGDANIISGNQIGTSNSGEDWGNNTNGLLETAGVRVRAAATNTLIENNRVGFNVNGLLLEGGSTRVCNNQIGMGLNEEFAGNLSEGVWVIGSGNIIGDPLNGCSLNVIGYNGSDGIEVRSNNNTIRRNQIGGIPSIDLGNGNGGILLVAGASNNDITGNTLWYNGNDGVRVFSNAGTGNYIHENSFGGNGNLGIDLNDDGVTANDTNDTDSGPNNLQNTPVITQIEPGAGQLTVTYRIDTAVENATYPLQANFYLSGPGTNQGKLFLEEFVYNGPPNSDKVVVINLPANIPSGGLMAMTIDSAGNSSEFSTPAGFTLLPTTGPIFTDGFED